MRRTSSHLLDKEFPVLGHGYVILREVMGTDQDIVDAARLSYGQGTRQVSKDKALIDHLMRHRHCYHPDMQVLTANGWMTWGDLEPGATYEFLVPYPQEHRLVKEKLVAECWDVEDEHMVTYWNNRMSFCVTHDHRMWFKKKKFRGTTAKPQFQIYRAAEMPQWGHFEPLTDYRFVGKYTPGFVGDKCNRMQFVGLYLGDGSAASKNRITFHLRKDREKKYLRQLVTLLKLSCVEKRSTTYDDAVVFTINKPNFLEDYTNFGARCKDKMFIVELSRLSRDEIHGLFDGLLHSDGHISIDRPQFTFSNTSGRLLDLYENLAAMLGMDGHRVKSTGGKYNINAYYGDRTTLEARREYFGDCKHTGKVWCTTSSTGLLIVRGSPMGYGFVCGNTSPFEMPVLRFQVKLPIFVERQWVRHRTCCVTGDTKITLIQPNGTPYKRTIKHIYDTKHGGVVDKMPTKTKNGVQTNGKQAYTYRKRYKNPTRIRILPSCQQRSMRVLDESSNNFVSGEMIEVYQTGVAPVFLIETVDGYSIKATENHQIYTARGWVRTKDLRVDDAVARAGRVALHSSRTIPPRLREGIGIWTQQMRRKMIPPGGTLCTLCGVHYMNNELVLDHKVSVAESLKLALDEDNLQPICRSCHRPKTNDEQKYAQRGTRTGVRFVGLKNLPVACGEEMTYDISMKAPHHNYLANDIIVHNSMNEMSGRYSELPEVYHLPTKFRVPDEHDKQASGGTKWTVGIDGEANVFASRRSEAARVVWANYQDELRAGVPREQAREPLPLAVYTEKVWQMNLHNLLHFLKLRTDSHAQWEIQQYAGVIEGIVAELFPWTYESWFNHIKHAVTFAADEYALLCEILDLNTEQAQMVADKIDESGMPKSRKRELKAKLCVG